MTIQKHLRENGNVIYGDLNRQTNSKIDFKGKNNILFLSKQATLSNADINFMGNNALIFIGDSCFKGRVLIFTNCLCYIGNTLGQSATNMSLNITSESYCIIGNDCLFSWGICIENSDHHPIFDCQTHVCLNVSHRNCLIGDHVWVGQWAWILKDTFLASGSIMGAKAVATKTYYSNTANVGIPAKQTRKGVFWNGNVIKDSTKEKIRQLEKAQTDDFSFSYDQDSFLSPKAIELKLESLQSAQEKLEFVYDYLYCNTSKNRFAYFENCPFEIPLPLMPKQFEKLNFESIKSPKPTPTPKAVSVSNPLQERISHLESFLFGTAVSRVQNHLAYKLGQILIKDSKTFSGILKLPFRILMVSYKHNKEQKQYNKKVQNNPNLKLPPLESYTDYLEALKIQNYFSYQLGKAFITANSVRGGGANYLLTLPFSKKCVS